MTIQVSLAEVRQRIDSARMKSPQGQAVTLLAVSKTHSADAVREVLAAGQRVFAENRVQEAAEKFPALRADYPDMQLHLIGPLQTNKVRDAVRLFDVIHTVDRADLAEKLAREMAKQNRPLPCFIQMNTGAEPQKAGVLPEQFEKLFRVCKTAGLDVRGLMCIPPADQPPTPHFEMLAQMAATHNLPWLSMGMSADYAEAIRCGSTHVRVGTTIFGTRE